VVAAHTHSTVRRPAPAPVRREGGDGTAADDRRRAAVRRALRAGAHEGRQPADRHAADERLADDLSARITTARARTAGGVGGASTVRRPPPAAAGSRAPLALPRLGTGSPVPGALRAPAEAVLGEDLGDVRLHTGPAAAQLARHHDAEAFTVGDHVVVGAGVAGSDHRLLAHELAHVVQQRQHGPALQRQATGRPSSPGAGGDPQRARPSAVWRRWAGSCRPPRTATRPGPRPCWPPSPGWTWPTRPT
jgi:hypothetical protein